MSDVGYQTSKEVSGLRILLVDDVYTTGARSQSAASALQLAGATVVGIVAIGRRINPGYNDFSLRLWKEQRAQSFQFGRIFEAHRDA
ncbi:phosphoribosyltransferase [Actinomadura sp. 6K520]|nr:phosphoribosyltransferase [Actinomadura sp. 6K520]